MLYQHNMYYHQLAKRLPGATINFQNDVIAKLCKPRYDLPGGAEDLETLRSELAAHYGLILLQYESGGVSAVTPYILQPHIQQAQMSLGMNFVETLVCPSFNFPPAIKQQLIRHLDASLRKGQLLHKALGYNSHQEHMDNHTLPEVLLKIHSALNAGFSFPSIMGVKAGLDSAIDGDLINMWVRDAVNILLALIAIRLDPELGKGLNIPPDAWKKLLIAMLKHHYRYLWRFTEIPDGRDLNAWPHIMYNPASLNEIDKRWGYAQVDALSMLGFALFWALNHKDSEGVPLLEWNDPEIQPMAGAVVCAMHVLFNKVLAWLCFDKSAWEDVSALHATSLGCATQFLLEQIDFFNSGNIITTEDNLPVPTRDSTIEMLSKFRNSLMRILPNEFLQSEFDPDGSQGKVRDNDIGIFNAMLLAAWSGRDFISREMDDRIFNSNVDMLMGPNGFMRYFKYPFDLWNGRENDPSLKKGKRAMDSEGMNWTHPEGQASFILGDKFQRYGDPIYGDGQTWHFNRDMAGFDRRPAVGNLPENWNKPEGWKVHPVTRERVADDNVPLAESTAASIVAHFGMRRTNRLMRSNIIRVRKLWYFGQAG